MSHYTRRRSGKQGRSSRSSRSSRSRTRKYVHRRRQGGMIGVII
jgi:hypothetical protein